MKTSTFIKYIILCMVPLFYACDKSSGEQEPDDDGSNSSAFTLQFDNFNYQGNLLVTFTDGTSKSAKMKDGKLGLPINPGGSKTIKSIQLDGQQPLLIGRKENENLQLRFENSVLVHRLPVQGIIPIGTYAEFQLINKDEAALTKSYQLEADLDLMNEEWTPIGTETDGVVWGFSGVFDGKDRSIQNLKITKQPQLHIGLFGRAVDHIYPSRTVAILKNINLSSGNITIKNGELSAKGSSTTIGAIAGAADYIENCKSYVDITVSDNYSPTLIGGIVGRVSSRTTSAPSGNANVKNCQNHGKINLHDEEIFNRIKNSMVGGIVGEGSSHIKIEACKNYGDIVGAMKVGGIAGYLSPGQSLDGQIITDCTNYGNISNHLTTGIQPQAFLGGIVSSAAYIVNCTNEGKVTNLRQDGAAAGIATEAISAKNCQNKADISSNGNSAGIVNTAIIFQSNMNTGNISGKNDVGGIASVMGLAGPYVHSVSGWENMMSSVSNYNTGNITGRRQVGGIGGSGTCTDCSNSGTVTRTGALDLNKDGFAAVGGILGNSGAVKQCYNVGKVFSNTGMAGNVPVAVGSLAGILPLVHRETLLSKFTGNFWKDFTDDDASQAFRYHFNYTDAPLPNNSAALFSATAWPQWALTATGWKSLGSWNNGNPTYPKLYFE